jgi:hypothetical protein
LIERIEKEKKIKSEKKKYYALLKVLGGGVKGNLPTSSIKIPSTNREEPIKD